MTELKPNITVPVDLTNPGQFYACCALLELSDRLWPEGEVTGGFAAPRFGRSRFLIFGKASFGARDVVRTLMECTRTPVDPYQPILGSNGKPIPDAKKILPLQLAGRISIRLSWWLDELSGRQTTFKMWAAHNTSEGLINDMAAAVDVGKINDETVLQLKAGMTARLGIDTRSSWNALDEGFSPNDQNLPVDTYPATELLAAVGLQSFGPSQQNGGYVYASWSQPLPLTSARAVASGLVALSGTTRYQFGVGARGKFKFFTKASLLEGNFHGRGRDRHI